MLGSTDNTSEANRNRPKGSGAARQASADPTATTPRADSPPDPANGAANSPSTAPEPDPEPDPAAAAIAAAPANGESVRVDSWIWSVRLLKIRSLAATACRGGHVRVNGERVKPAHSLRVGDEVRLRHDGQERIVVVKRLIRKRVGAPVAVQCYVDNSPPPPPREAVAPIGIRDRGAGRPTKRDRRDLERLRGFGTPSSSTPGNGRSAPSTAPSAAEAPDDDFDTPRSESGTSAEVTDSGIPLPPLSPFPPRPSRSPRAQRSGSSDTSGRPRRSDAPDDPSRSDRSGRSGSRSGRPNGSGRRGKS